MISPISDSALLALARELHEIQEAIERAREELASVEKTLGSRKMFAVAIPSGWDEYEINHLERALAQNFEEIEFSGGWEAAENGEERARKWCRTVLRKYAESLVPPKNQRK
jgi:hypothetical protein